MYVPNDLKKKRTRMLKPLSNLEKMHPNYTNIFTSNTIDNTKIS